MDWLTSVGAIWLDALKWLAGLAVVFFVLTRLTPCNPGMYWWRNLRGTATDALYWLVVPIFLRLCRTLMLIAGVTVLCGGQEPHVLPVRGLPLWQQCVLVLLVQDVFLYAMHRAFHTGWAWKFHAVHHSPKELDWVATQRFHPLNNLLTFTLADVGILLLGFDPQTLLWLTPFNIVYSTMVHANLNWTFGPLRYVFASPVFHRWHHTTEKEAIDKNFASTFPVLDLLFGTFYMPPGKLPERFGTGEDDVPEDFLGQLLHPFRNGDAAGQGTLRRPAVLALKGACLLAAVGLLAAGTYLTAGLVDRNAQLTRDLQQTAAAVQAIQLDAAARAWADNDLVLATAVLKGIPESTEQRRLGDLCRQKCRVLTGHKGAVLCVAVSGDGRRVVSGSADRTVKVWDADTGREEKTLEGHQGPVLSVAVSGNGHCIVSGSADLTAKVWYVETGPIIVRGTITTKLMNMVTGQAQHTLHGDPGAVVGVAVSADGRHVVTASARTAKVWDAASGKEVVTLAGHTDLVYGVAVSPDGHRVVTAGYDEKVRIWDAPEGRETLTLMGHKGPVYGVALGLDGQTVASGSNDRTVRLWDAARGREVLALKGHTDAVTGVALSPDGRRLIAGGRDGAVTVWDIPNCASH